MKSLLERPLARPFLFAAVIIAAVAAIGLLWWLLGSATTSATTKTVTNALIVKSPVQPIEISSATTAISETNATDSTSLSAVNNALPTDSALAEEELDRLNDENTRLKDRKAQLEKQLDISNKLLAMKEQQLRMLETPDH